MQQVYKPAPSTHVLRKQTGCIEPLAKHTITNISRRTKLSREGKMSGKRAVERRNVKN